jgi:hypothetical protein
VWLTDLADRLSDKDDADGARVHRVASRNDFIFGSLKTVLEEMTSRYNERHPQGRCTPNSLITNSSWNSPMWSLYIKKITTPPSSLKVEFFINSGAMQLYEPTGKRITITLDIADNSPVYYVGGKPHSVNAIADFLLRLLLCPKGKFDCILPP